MKVFFSHYYLLRTYGKSLLSFEESTHSRILHTVWQNFIEYIKICHTVPQTQTYMLLEDGRIK